MAKRSGERLYRKKETFYGWYYTPATQERVVVCTHTRDRESARAYLRKVERDAYEAHASGRPPSYSQAHTVAAALDYFVSKGCNDVAVETLGMYAKKAGHLLRLVGTVEVNALKLEDVQDQIKEKLYSSALESRFQRWIEEALRKGHEVVIK